MRIEYIAEGAPECPLVLLRGPLAEGAEAFLAAVMRLGEGAVDEVALDALDGIHSALRCSLEIAKEHAAIGVHLLDGGRLIRWTDDREGWLMVADLARPVIGAHQRRHAGFQFLVENAPTGVVISTDGAW